MVSGDKEAIVSRFATPRASFSPVTLPAAG
jgi:hypothetical protein